MPRYEYAGFGQYETLFELDRWWVAATNLGKVWVTLSAPASTGVLYPPCRRVYPL